MQDYIRRIQRRVFGIITALEKPTLLSEVGDQLVIRFILSYSHHIDIALLQDAVSTLVKSKMIQGSVKSGSFIPQIYEDRKSNAVVSFLRDNQYITKKLLKDNRVKEEYFL